MYLIVVGYFTDFAKKYPPYSFITTRPLHLEFAKFGFWGKKCLKMPYPAPFPVSPFFMTPLYYHPLYDFPEKFHPL